MRGKKSFCREGIVFMKISNGVLKKVKTSNILITDLTIRTIMKNLNAPFESLSIMSKNIVIQLYKKRSTSKMYRSSWLLHKGFLCFKNPDKVLEVFKR